MIKNIAYNSHINNNFSKCYVISHTPHNKISKPVAHIIRDEIKDAIKESLYD